MDHDRLVGSGLVLAAGFQLLVTMGIVISPGPLLTVESGSSVAIAIALGAVGVSFLSDGGSTVDGSWGWRIMAVLTAFVIVSSGLSAFFALT